MRILLSAYACEPGKGSEPGVGWNWANELARQGHEVSVITRANNRPSIARALASVEPDVRFYYYDLPVWLAWWKKGKRGIRLYYLLWQWGAYRLAQRLHAESPFDLVHHITFGVLRHPSFMGKLGIPFVFGPVGGGEQAPRHLLEGVGLRGAVLERVRDFSNIALRFDPLMRHAFRRASVILAKTPDTARAIPPRFRNKTAVCLEIGLDPRHLSAELPLRKERSTLRILYAGRFIYWKGMHIGLRAFAKALQRVPTIELTMIGAGPDERSWRALAERLGVAESITWHGWLTQEALSNHYREHDVFLFPSLHDSSGNVVLEAMRHGLPVLCLALGGPGVIVGQSSGFAIQAKDRTLSAVIDEMADRLATLARDGRERRRLSSAARVQAGRWTWASAVSQAYRTVEPRIAAFQPSDRRTEHQTKAVS